MPLRLCILWQSAIVMYGIVCLGQDISPLTFSEAMTYAGIGIVSALAASISGISFGKRLIHHPFHPPHLRRHTDHIIWLLLFDFHHCSLGYI